MNGKGKNVFSKSAQEKVKCQNHHKLKPKKVNTKERLTKFDQSLNTYA